MKKLILFSTLILLAFATCKENNPIEEDDPVINNFMGTSWTAQHEFLQWFYGGECTTTIEFLTENTCQEIEIIKGAGLANGTRVRQEKYTYKNDSVSWTSEKTKISAKITGSILSTDVNTLSGGKRIYTKNK